jgi:hypothetical protein
MTESAQQRLDLGALMTVSVEYENVTQSSTPLHQPPMSALVRAGP